MDDPSPLPDIRVISITLEAPAWKPKVEWGDDFDDYSVPTILRLAADALHDELLDAILSEDDDDDE
jgi:hypothetical protein